MGTRRHAGAFDEQSRQFGEELIMNTNYGTIWVCQDCMLHHANGECGGCSDLYGPHDEEPLSSIGDGFHVAMGMAHEEHSEDCETRIQGRQPDDYECDCET